MSTDYFLVDKVSKTYVFVGCENASGGYWLTDDIIPAVRAFFRANNLDGDIVYMNEYSFDDWQELNGIIDEDADFRTIMKKAPAQSEGGGGDL